MYYYLLFIYYSNSSTNETIVQDHYNNKKQRISVTDTTPVSLLTFRRKCHGGAEVTTGVISLISSSLYLRTRNGRKL